jgi:hypothetical protein
MGERGFIKLRLTCPRRESLCRVDLQLRRRGRTVGRVRTRVRGVKTRTVRLRIRAKPRAKIVERGSLRVGVPASRPGTTRWRSRRPDDRSAQVTFSRQRP